MIKKRLNLERKMKEQRITGKELASLLGMSVPYFSMKLNCHFDFTDKEQIKIAKLLNVKTPDIEELFREL